jgi:hypothetical protein
MQLLPFFSSIQLARTCRSNGEFSFIVIHAASVALRLTVTTFLMLNRQVYTADLRPSKTHCQCNPVIGLRPQLNDVITRVYQLIRRDTNRYAIHY